MTEFEIINVYEIPSDEDDNLLSRGFTFIVYNLDFKMKFVIYKRISFSEIENMRDEFFENLYIEIINEASKLLQESIL